MNPRRPGPAPGFEPPAFPVRPDPLRRWRHLAPERTALLDAASGRRWSYRELDAAADRWTGRLRALGVGRGDRVAVLARDRPETIHLYFACGRVGAVLVPLNWRLAAPELAGILSDAGPAVLFGEAEFREAAGGAMRLLAPEDATGERPVSGGTGAVGDEGSVPWLDLDEPPRARPRRAEETGAGSGGPREGDEDGGGEGGDVPVGPHDPLMILYTSGSTGRPKGVVIPHRQVLFNAVATTTAWELGPDDVAPISTPLFHTGGWHCFATPLWLAGGTVVLMGPFDPDRFLGTLAETGCTVSLTVPTQLQMLREGAEWGLELAAFRAFYCGGAPLPEALGEACREAGYRVREGYGLTECGPNCFAMEPDRWDRQWGWVGRPVPFLEMRLETAAGERPPTGEPGELLLRGPQMFGGYFRDPERTAEALTDDGWLRTGDLAVRSEEGLYAIRGRKKEMFISGGENVYPGEVEAAIAGCPGVASVVVVAVPHEKWGEVGRAFVVAEADAERDSGAVLEWARERLARYKVPKSVAFLDELPRLGSGKVDRAALAERAAEGEGAAASPPEGLA